MLAADEKQGAASTPRHLRNSWLALGMQMEPTGTMRSNRMNGAGWHMLFRGRGANRLARSNGWPAPSKPNKASAMMDGFSKEWRGTKTGIGLNSPTSRPPVRQFRGMISDDKDGAQITPRSRRR